MSEERITYEEFMIMFKNAPRIAYTLYDKAEDEIKSLQQKVEQLEERCEYLERSNKIGYNLKHTINNLLILIFMVIFFFFLFN